MRLIFKWLIFLLFIGCSSHEEPDKYSLMHDITNSELVVNNSGEFFFPYKRKRGVLTYVDNSNISYLIDTTNESVISTTNKGQGLDLETTDFANVIKKVMSVKDNMDDLKIKAIYPEKSKFLILTKIRSDSTYKTLKKYNTNYRDIFYTEKNGDYFFALIKFNNQKDSIIEKYKKDFSLRNLNDNWFYYRFQN